MVGALDSERSNSWKFDCTPCAAGYASMTTRYGPGLVNVTDSDATPFAPIGGWRWMIVARSRRTMIRWTPVCGPGPRLNWVSV
jgi:hypothetical protein